MCFGGGKKYKAEYAKRLERMVLVPGGQRNPNWDPNNPYDYPKYYYVRGQYPAQGGAGYQPVQGMQAGPSQHGAGSRATAAEGLGGRNNPYGSGRSGAGPSQHGAGSRATAAEGLAGRNNPSVSGRSGARPSREADGGASGRRGTDNSRRSGNEPSRRSGAHTSGRSGADATARNRNQPNREAAAHSNIRPVHYIPDNVTRRPSPPPLHRRR